MIQFVGGVFALFFLFAIVRTIDFADLLWDIARVLVVLGVIGGFFLLAVMASAKMDEPRKEAERKRAASDLDQVLAEHLEELRRKKRVLVVDKGYGIVDTSAWDKEKRFFISKVVAEKFPSAVSVLGDFEISAVIDRRIDAAKPFFKTPVPASSDPVGYEHFCADILTRAGWKVVLTKASGDQGADLIASKYGKSVAVQCKRYEKPVGNKAVQEVYAARQHYGSDAAVVVSSSGFTPHAKALASSTGVLLLDHEQLRDL